MKPNRSQAFYDAATAMTDGDILELPMLPRRLKEAVTLVRDHYLRLGVDEASGRKDDSPTVLNPVPAGVLSSIRGHVKDEWEV